MAQTSQVLAEAARHFNSGHLHQAERLCRNVLKTEPNSIPAFQMLGRIAVRKGNASEACEHFRHVLKIDPLQHLVRVELGRTLLSLDKLDQAAVCFTEAIELNANLAEPFLELGALFQNRGLLEDALRCYRNALLIEPRNAKAHCNMGLAFLFQARLSDAEASLSTAIKLDEKLTAAYDGLGLHAAFTNNQALALNYFERALAINPHFVSTHLNLAIGRLRSGDIKGGMQEWEYRFKTEPLKNIVVQRPRPFSQPRWQGEPLEDKGLLVWGEQGIGDEIRNARIVHELASRGSRVTLECSERLVEIFQRSLNNVEIVARSNPPSKKTRAPLLAYQTPADSLLAYDDAILHKAPISTAFLQPSSDLKAQFVSQYRAVKQPLVGLAWGSYNDQLSAVKSTGFADWSPIFKTKNVEFVSLQEREAQDSSVNVNTRILWPDHDLKNNLDTLAALITACDLVITVSNTTAHLAGALGVPTWVLLPFGHFQPWYWFAERTDSPWYPSVKLYRQKKFGDWPRVLSHVADDLKNWLKSR